jgi:hypothetical protein
MFRFLTQQVELAASVRDSEVVRNVASVALQVMQRCDYNEPFRLLNSCKEQPLIGFAFLCPALTTTVVVQMSEHAGSVIFVGCIT